MKIKRYSFGETNLAQLSRAREGVMSPGQAAELAAAPYEAMAGAVNSATGAIVEWKEAENRAIDAEDANKYDLNVAATKDRMDRLAKQAKAENWTPEKLVEANQQEIRKFASAIDTLSPRNRDKYAQRMGLIAESLAENTRLDANILRAQNARTMAETSLDIYLQSDSFDDALLHIAKNRDLGIWGADEASALAMDVSARQQAKDWASKYQAAVSAGTEDKLMQQMGEANLSDDVWAYFSKDAQKINAAADAVRAQIASERSIEWNDYKDGITSATKREEVKAWIRERPWLNNDQRNGLFNALDQGETTKQIILDKYADLDAKATRKAFDSELNRNAKPEENATMAAAIAQQYRVVPLYWSNLVNYLATSDTPAELSEAGKYVMQMEEAAPGINLHLNDKAEMKVRMYIDTVTRTKDAVSAAATVTTHFANVTEQEVEARKARWENENYGPDNKSPKDFIFEELDSRLSDTNTPIGQMFAGDLGEGWFNRADPYSRKTVYRNPLMEDTLQTLAYRFYTAGASEEVAIESAIRAARNMGFAATDVNYGVPWAGDTEHKYQIQRNPITRQGEQVIPQAQIRSLINADIKNLEYMRVNDSVGVKPRKYDIGEIVVGDGIIDELKTVGDKPNPNYGKLKWPLLSRGSQLTINGQPQYWWFDPQSEQQSTKEVAEEEAMGAIEQATLESRLKQATGGIL